MHPRSPVANKVRKKRFVHQVGQHCHLDEQSESGRSSQSTLLISGCEESLYQWLSGESRLMAGKNTSPD
ncbi:hypothetical protein SAMN05421647_101502 [Marinobacterium stanieri]|uniref:Uncharacterized protein n=1 Tax=Marinobacterium stanieri TaxID=49186 RepID=A0A1N6NR95_9GAMM|nr:hypothetical protein SAMN05421647_101502 [Marinobacterium stanieri]